MRFENRNALSLLALLAVANVAFSQNSAPNSLIPIHLQVDAGTPLRIYITRRVPYRLGEVVEAKLIEPVWAFDRIVIPAGSTLHGQVVGLVPVPKMLRARAILGGDFTPLKRAQVSFANLTLPDGHSMSLQTEASLGLATIYDPPRPPKKPKKQKPAPAKPANQGGAWQFVRQQAELELQRQASARSHGVYDLVRGQNKREWIENWLWAKLPYHPQRYRARTRFDSVLTQPLDFGTAEIASSELTQTGTAMPPDAVGQMRLLTTISSADAQVGDPMEGVLSQPIFSSKHELVLPQGTRFTGKITLSQHARLFHRGGKLRFAIENADPPENEVAADRAAMPAQTSQRVQGQLLAVEADPNVVKVDSEGTATATESKTRLLRPAIAALVAVKSLDNDEGKLNASGQGVGPNTTGQTLGGFSGFGLLGIPAARLGPPAVGAALGFYGLAWSVYSNVVARGSEITFEKNTAIAIQFGDQRKK